MLRFTPFHPGHLRFLRVQDAQSGDLIAVTPQDVEALRDTLAFSGFVAERCVGCAGLYDIWRGHAKAWALLSPECRPYMLQITRYVGRVLACYPARRIEATVLAEFAAGCRWLERLGFEREDRNGLRGYDTTGRTFALYARIK